MLNSTLNPASARLSKTVLAGDGWSCALTRGETLRIVDLEGNQAVDTMFYDLQVPAERYDATMTIQRSGQLYLTAGIGSDRHQRIA